MVNPFAASLLVVLKVSSPLMAKDFGTQGMISPIEEADPIQLIQNKLQGMDQRGELEAHNRELQKKTRASIERPKPVEGVTRAETARTFYFNPTYRVAEDIKDHTGKVFAAKGTKLNPLETVSLSHTLLFFDGDDEDQLAFATTKLQEAFRSVPVKLILVKGAPLSLSEELNALVYFDQGGP